MQTSFQQKLSFSRFYETDQQWKHEIRNAITSPHELLKKLGLFGQLKDQVAIDSDFKMLVPDAFIEKMTPNETNDPLLLQVLPLHKENSTNGLIDPVGERYTTQTPGLLHKYNGRALLITTGACAIHCRYCFRRHYPYNESCAKKESWRPALEYLSNHKDIMEVILSGGDPLMLDDNQIELLLKKIEEIKHIKFLRIHTRLPVVLPSRFTRTLLNILHDSRFKITIVVHCNHANEIGSTEYEVFNALRLSGVILLNQSVLLRDINDSALTLKELSVKLYDSGVVPYYLHMLDPVQGAMHFDTETAIAIQLLEDLRNQLPGYMVPRLVRENPGEPSKTAIFHI